MKYLLEGPQADVVLQENRNRIAMGMVKITPVADEVVEPAEEAPKVPETEKEQEQQPVAPEVPETDSKEPAAESDAKAAPEGEDNKEVTADADSKDSQVADEKEPAQEEPKKSTRSTKK